MEAPNWGWIYSHLSASAGLSSRDIDEMEYHEIEELFNYWKKNPPTHIMVQGFFKMSGEDSPASSSEVPKNELTEKQFLELTSMFPQN